MEVQDAIHIAAGAHKEQTDLSGNPYILHPLRVMLSIEQSGYPDDMIDDLMVVAVLHDLLEDTEWSEFDLESVGVTPKQSEAIVALTRRSGETYADFILRCVQNRLARIVKIHDINDNLRPRRGEALPEEQRDKLATRYHRALEILDPNAPLDAD